MGYPPGNLIRCEFQLTTRPLTPQERAAFDRGDGLPVGIGRNPDPDVVLFDYIAPGADVVTLIFGEEDGRIVKDEAGAFHVIVDANVSGLWWHRGYAQTSAGGSDDGSPWKSFPVDPASPISCP